MSVELKAWQLVKHTASALREGSAGLNDVPVWLRKLLKDDGWRSFELSNGEPVEWRRFSEFVSARPLRGLGSDMEAIERVVADDPELLRMIRQADKVGRGHRSDLQPDSDSESGMSSETTGYTAQRLAEQHPEQYAQVLERQTSVNAAAIAAGIRPRRVSVRTDNMQSAASTLYRQLSPGMLRVLLDELNALTREGRS